MTNGMENKKYDIFISYRHNNMTLINEFVHKLEPYYNVFWDQRLESGYWDKQLEKAIDDSKVVVINLNTNSLEKNKQGEDWFYREIVYSMNNKCPNEIIPICYDKYKIPDELNISGITDEEKEKINILREKQQAIIDIQELDEIISRLVVLLEGLGIKTKIPYKPGMVEPNFLELAPISSTKSFIGRKDELAKLEQLFQDNDIVFLSGIGGIGKTELAKKYMEKKAGEYRCVFCRYDISLKNTLGQIKIKGIEGNDFNEKEKVLKELLKDNVLLVIDNFDFEDDEDIDSYIDKLCEYSCKKLITTRNKFSDIDAKYEMLSIESLTDEELKELFEEKYKGKINNEQFERILDFTGGLTMAIPILASLCYNSGMEVDELCEKISGGLKNLEDSEKIRYNKDGNKRGTVPEIIRVLFDIENMNEQKKKCLRNMSLLQFMYVTRKVYKDIAFFNSTGNLNDFNDLVESNWIKEIVGETRDNTYFELHPIINELVREDLKPNPDNCPEVFGYITKKAEVIKNETQEYNMLSSRYWSLEDREGSEFVCKFINNLNMADEENILFAYTELEKRQKYWFNENLISDTVLNALKKHILNKECYIIADYKLLKIISHRIPFMVGEVKKVLNLFDLITKKCISNGAKERFKHMINRIMSNIGLNLSNEERNGFYVEIEKYGINKEQLCNFPIPLETKQGRTFYVDSQKANKVFEVKENILKAENYKESLEGYFEGRDVLRKQCGLWLFDDYLSVVLCEKYVNRETIYEEVSKFEDFLYSKICKGDVIEVIGRKILKEFLICYKYFGFTGMKPERCKEFIKYNCGYLGDKIDDKIVDIIACYYCGDKLEFEKTLERHFLEQDKILDVKDMLGLYGHYVSILQFHSGISADYLLNPVINTISYMEQNFAENEDYNSVLESWYKWAVGLALNCGEEQLKKTYSEKLQKYKNKRLGYKLKLE